MDNYWNIKKTLCDVPESKKRVIARHSNRLIFAAFFKIEYEILTKLYFYPPKIRVRKVSF